MGDPGPEIIRRTGTVDPRSVSIGGALSAGWAAFQKHVGVAIGGYLIYVAISFVANWIPFVNIIFGLLVGFAFMGGLTILYLNIVKDENPVIGDLFAGFKDFWKWVGVGWLYVAVVAVSAVPLGIAILVGVLIVAPMEGRYGSYGDTSGAVMAVVIALGSIVTLILLIALIMRWVFAYYAAAEGAGAIDAFKRSAQMTEGIRLKLFGIYFVLGLFASAGLLALGVGIIVTGIISSLAQTSIYLALKPQPPQLIQEPTPTEQ